MLGPGTQSVAGAGRCAAWEVESTAENLDVSFGDAATGDLYHGSQTRRVRHFPHTILQSALRKLDMLNAAQRLQDLREPPGNRLESLTGDLEGFYSIRINDQWRIIFRWSGSNASDVTVVEYH
jgi:toxin HigB-1